MQSGSDPGLRLRRQMLNVIRMVNEVHAILVFLPKGSRVEPLLDWTTTIRSLIILKKIVCWEIVGGAELNQCRTLSLLSGRQTCTQWARSMFRCNRIGIPSWGLSIRLHGPRM